MPGEPAEQSDDVMKDRYADVVRETAVSYGNEDDLLTYDDYLRMPEGIRYELLEGELLMTPSPTPMHQTVLNRLNRIFLEQLEDRGLGKVFVAPLDIVLSEHNVAQPDILFISKDRLGIIGKANVRGAPDLVVSLVNPVLHHVGETLSSSLFPELKVDMEPLFVE